MQPQRWNLSQRKRNFIINSKQRQKYYDKDFALTDSLIKNQFNGFKYVKNEWQKRLLVDFDENQRITEFMKLDSMNLLVAPDSKHVVKYDYHGLYLINDYGHEDTLVNIYRNENMQDLCFQNYCWDDKGDKLYFDNSGEIACIWELDFPNKTIDKIIPEHYAEKPVYASNALFYINENGLYKCQFSAYGNEVDLNDPHLYDTLSRNQLSAEDYNITAIDSFPSKMEFQGSKSAYLAVKCTKQTFIFKLLFDLTNELFFETSTITIYNEDYKCYEPKAYFSNNKIEFIFDDRQGIIHKELFTIKDYALRYQVSQIIEIP